MDLESDKIYQDFCNYVATEKDITLMIMKGHLISEKFLDDIIFFKIDNESKGKNIIKFSYSQKIKIFNALFANSDSLFGILESLNDLRNQLVHSLNSKEFRPKYKIFEEKCGVNLLFKNKWDELAEPERTVRKCASALSVTLGQCAAFKESVQKVGW